MKRSTYLTITAIIGILSGIGMFLSPASSLQMSGITGLNEYGIILARDVGIFLFVIGIMNAIVRNAPDSKAMTGILVANLLSHLLPFLLDGYNTMIGTLNPQNWFVVIEHGILTLGFAYYLRKAAQNNENLKSITH
jgi:hypothetical protein